MIHAHMEHHLARRLLPLVVLFVKPRHSPTLRRSWVPLYIQQTQAHIPSEGDYDVSKALISGITGQDGSYLAELLLQKGYEVHGVVRRVALEDAEHRMTRIQHLLPRLHLHAASLESFASIYNVIAKVKPTECYHLAAQSFVSYSFEDEFSTLNTNINGTHHMLAAIKDVAPRCKFYFAASSEMFGKVRETPQRESTPFHPRSAYGISKVAGYELTRNYREAYGIHATAGILYNHESPRRGFEFVTRKITSHVARIKLGLTNRLALGNLDALRDWGHARDYVQAMWLMLQQEDPDDYVIATGETWSVADFCAEAFACADLDWRDYVVTDPRFFRPAEVHILLGDATKAMHRLGWEPTYTFKGLVHEMVREDLSRLTRSSQSSEKATLTGQSTRNAIAPTCAVS
jgi:GDPmannose 4,6-dehydratase